MKAMYTAFSRSRRFPSPSRFSSGDAGEELGGVGADVTAVGPTSKRVVQASEKHMDTSLLLSEHITARDDGEEDDERLCGESGRMED